MMERDKNRMIEDETLETEENVQAGSATVEREVNDMTYFLELLKHLRALLEQGTNIPMTRRALVNTEDALSIMDDLEANLPDAIQYGMQMYSEQDRIMGEAENDAITRVTTAEMQATKKLESAREEAEKLVREAETDANAILEDAEERAAHMVSEDEIVRRAREEARAIRNDARVEAGEIRLKASHDAHRLLSSMEGKLEDTLKEIRRMRADTTTEEQ